MQHTPMRAVTRPLRACDLGHSGPGWGSACRLWVVGHPAGWGWKQSRPPLRLCCFVFPAGRGLWAASLPPCGSEGSRSRLVPGPQRPQEKVESRPSAQGSLVFLEPLSNIKNMPLIYLYA